MFTIGAITVYAYGFFFALGIVASYLACLFFARREEQNTGVPWVRHADGALVPIVLGGIVGARLFFVAYQWNFFLQHPWEIISIWNGGLVLHGGILGGLIALWLYSRIRAIHFLNILSFVVLVLPLGQAIGRWGNYFNQEAYGLPTMFPWGIPIEAFKRVAGYESFPFFHPTFLYESVWDLIVFCILVVLATQKKLRSGFIVSSYLILYSIGRFCIEFIRIDPVPVIGGLRVPQWVSLLLIGGGVVFLVHLLSKKKKSGTISP
ncbi:MAG: prolipoprotein diacylglyceryl transferase [bacterium]|nr:prolipoprotein diacylglyceryl transferase [bacterium]